VNILATKALKDVFITGVSGYFGQKLVSLLDNKNDVGHVVGIDIKEPSQKAAKLEFIKHDIRDDLSPILNGRRIDWVIHSAFIVPPIHDKNKMEDININGTKNVFDACVKFGIQHLVHCSSTTAYGFHKDNPPLLTEESPLRGNDDFTYSKNKKELELFCKEFQGVHPSFRLTVIRPCFVVGLGFNNPLSHHLIKDRMFLPRDAAPFQFIHEDDLVEIIYLLLANEKRGIYNLTADGTISFDEMAKVLGNKAIYMPGPVLRFFNRVLWFLHSKHVEFPASVINMLQYPWIASNEKVKKDLNYAFKYTTKEAFIDFASHIKRSRI